jgi:hypothetical protein
VFRQNFSPGIPKPGGKFLLAFSGPPRYDFLYSPLCIEIINISPKRDSPEILRNGRGNLYVQETDRCVRPDVFDGDRNSCFGAEV